MGVTAIDPRARFERYVCYVGDCIVWTGFLFPNGYGQFHPSTGVSGYAHRFAFEQVFGPIPKKKVINHLCRNRMCVNPGHLEIISHKENLLHPQSLSPSGLNARKTHCPKGHSYSGDNTVMKNTGARACRTCIKKVNKKQYEIRKSRTVERLQKA